MHVIAAVFENTPVTGTAMIRMLIVGKEVASINHSGGGGIGIGGGGMYDNDSAVDSIRSITAFKAALKIAPVLPARSTTTMPPTTTPPSTTTTTTTTTPTTITTPTTTPTPTPTTTASPRSHQTWNVMSLLHHCASASRTNLTLCCEHKVLVDVLEVYRVWQSPNPHDEKMLLALLVMFASHHCNSEMVRQLFVTLYSNSNNNNNNSSNNNNNDTDDNAKTVVSVAQQLKLQNALVSMTRAKASSAAAPFFVHLSGTTPRMSLPTVRLTSSGYGAHVWVNIWSQTSKSASTVAHSRETKGVIFIPTTSHTAKPQPQSSSRHNKIIGGKSSSEDLVGEPRLLHLQTKKGVGVELILSDRNLLVLLNYGQGVERRIINPGVILALQAWTLVSVVHVAHRTSLSTPDFKVFVNGVLQFKLPAKLFNTKLPFDDCWIGVPHAHAHAHAHTHMHTHAHAHSVYKTKSSAPSSTSTPPSSHAASVSSTRSPTNIEMEVVSCLVTHGVADTAVAYLASLGKDYIGTYDHQRSAAAVNTTTTTTSSSTTTTDTVSADVPDTSLSARIVLYVHAKAIHTADGDVTNLVAHPSEHGDPGSIASGAALHLRNLFDIVQAEGGSLVGLLCLANIDSLVQRLHATSNPHDASTGTELSLLTMTPKFRAFVQKATAAGLVLFRSFLSRTPGKDILPSSHRNSIVMVAGILRTSRWKVMAIETVSIIDNMLKECASRPSQLAILNHLIYDATLWQTAPSEVQLVQLQSLLSITRNSPNYTWHKFGVHGCMDRLSRLAHAGHTHQQFGDVVLKVLDTFLTESKITASSVRQVLACIRVCDNEFAATQLSLWMLRHIQHATATSAGKLEDPTFVAKSESELFVVALTSNGPPVELYTCLQKPYETARTLIMMCIAELCKDNGLLCSDHLRRMRLSGHPQTWTMDVLMQHPSRVNVDLFEAFITMALATSLFDQQTERDVAHVRSCQILVSERQRKSTTTVQNTTTTSSAIHANEASANPFKSSPSNTPSSSKPTPVGFGALVLVCPTAMFAALTLLMQLCADTLPSASDATVRNNNTTTGTTTTTAPTTTGTTTTTAASSTLASTPTTTPTPTTSETKEHHTDDTETDAVTDADTDAATDADRAVLTFCLGRAAKVLSSVEDLTAFTSFGSWQRTVARLFHVCRFEAVDTRVMNTTNANANANANRVATLTSTTIAQLFSPDVAIVMDLLTKPLFADLMQTGAIAGALGVVMATIKAEVDAVAYTVRSRARTNEAPRYVVKWVVLQAWLLVKLLEESCARVRHLTQEQSGMTIRRSMLHLIFVAERVLYMEEWGDDEIARVVRTVVAAAVVRFAHDAEVEFDSTIALVLPTHDSSSKAGSGSRMSSEPRLSSSSPSSSSSSPPKPVVVGGGNTDVVRAGGFLRLILRLVLQELCSHRVPSLPASYNAACTALAMQWLNRFRIAGKIETNLSQDMAMYIIWHLGKKLETCSANDIASIGDGVDDDDDGGGDGDVLTSRRQQAAALTMLVQLFRRFVKWWWWCLDFNTDTNNNDNNIDDKAPTDLNDVRLTADEPIETTFDMLKSQWWQSLVKTKLDAVIKFVVAESHIEACSGTDMLRMRQQLNQDKIIAENDLQSAAADAIVRAEMHVVLQTTVEPDDTFVAHQRELARKRDKAHAQAMTMWIESRRFLKSPRGILGLTAQPHTRVADVADSHGGDGVRGGSGGSDGRESHVIGAVYGEWRMDNTEDFSRIRRKLAPIYDGFDAHHEASAIRDDPSLAKTFALDTALQQSQASMLSKIEPKYIPEDSADLLFHGKAHLVRYMSTVPGTLIISNAHMQFFSDVADETSEDRLSKMMESSTDFEISLTNLRELHVRRYNLRPIAMEVFLVDQTNYMVMFESKSERDLAFKAVQSAKPPSLMYAEITGSSKLLHRSGLTKRWQQRAISNFEYLMQLNTLAGRTYNDLNQYPVFPWIIADYTSAELDLSQPSSFRDLTKPMGAMNEERVEMLQQMYEQNDDPMMGRFHYGTHYSNAATVLHYLIRLEPYTSLHINLQTNRFDHADRLFVSLPQSWEGIVKHGHGDVKELIPELFFLPECLDNSSKFDLGTTQKGIVVGDVLLPPWAKDSREFILKNREALESEHVSQHLHHWIDLIFGFKQRGPEAAKAVNCFLQSSYEGVVDLDAIENAHERTAMEHMVRELGQTPSQLLTHPHPPRNTHDKRRSSSPSPKRQLSTTSLTMSRTSSGRLSPSPSRKQLRSNSSLAFDVSGEWKLGKAYFADMDAGGRDGVAVILVPFIDLSLKGWMRSGMVNALITISNDCFWAVHNWLPSSSSHGRPFTLDTDCAYKSTKNNFSNSPLQNGRPLSSRTVVSLADNSMAIVAGALDNTVKIFQVSSTIPSRFRLLSSSTALHASSSCLALDVNGETVAVGYSDGVCATFKLRREVSVSKADSASADTHTKSPKCWLEGPISLLYGHQAQVTCIEVCEELDMMVAGSYDGYLNVYTVRTPHLVYTIAPEHFPLGTTLTPSPSTPASAKAPTPSTTPTRNHTKPPPTSAHAAPTLQLQRSTPVVVSLALSKHGTIIAHSVWRGGAKRKAVLCSYSINGKRLAVDFTCGILAELVLNHTGMRVIACKRKGVVQVRDVETLSIKQTISTNNAQICSAAITNDGSRLLLGLEDGKLVIVAASGE